VRSAGRLAFAAIVFAALVACGQQPKIPQPSQELVPDRIGVVVAWDWIDCMPGRYTLDSGDVVELVAGTGACGDRQHTPTPTLETQAFNLPGAPGPFPEGPLVMYAGAGRAPDWYALASRPFSGDGTCPFELRAAAYHEGVDIHFGSGLLLPVADTFVIEPSWIEDPHDLLPRGGVTWCLDRTGQVLRARIDTIY
jgi:hypothetical protein